MQRKSQLMVTTAELFSCVGMTEKKAVILVHTEQKVMVERERNYAFSALYTTLRSQL